MHPYATDSNERFTVLSLIGLLSVVLALGLSQLLAYLQWTVPWYIDAPSVLGFYGLIYFLINKFLWRQPLMHRLPLVAVPDLGGVWNGYLCSSYDGHQTKYPATLTIRQEWVDICIELATENSHSHSVIASIVTRMASGATLSYEYVNEPKSHALYTMHTHRGTGHLALRKANSMLILEGDYYTGRDRENHGTLYFEQTNTAAGHA